MSSVIESISADCKWYSERDASFSNHCPAVYLELDECPFDKSCKDVTLKDWVKILEKEIESLKKEQ